MAPPTKKRKVNGNHTNGDDATNGTLNSKVFPNPPLAAATPIDKQRWQGFCEIESEPAFFNVMLKDFGVKGVKVQEVFGLDEDLLSMLPRPIYGLIFLFRYALDANEQEAVCPDHVWFANQTHEFSCATTSLLNIVNNIPDVDIGEQLQSFKDFTQSLTPAQRGDQIGNFEFVKQVHNSFARKMDMLNIDLGMENAYDERTKSKKKAAPPKGKKGKIATDDDYVADDNAFHFIAYVPIGGDVWKLDGLDRQPSKYGKITGDDWLPTVVPRIEQRMESLSSGGIEFGLLSLVKDPIVGYQEDLRRNMVCYMELVMELMRRDAAAQAAGSTKPSFMKDVVSDHSNAYMDLSGGGISEAQQTALGIPTSGLLDQQITTAYAQKLSTASTSDLLALRIELKNEYPAIKRSIQDELSQARDDRRRATERRNEYGPLIHAWLKMLADKEGVVRDLIDETR